MKKVKYIEQYDEKDCGPTCLAMISQYFGKNVSIPRLREWAKTDRLGTNLYGLIQAADKIGIQLTGVQADSISDLEHVSCPFIAHIINQQGYEHFVIIEKIKKQTFFIVDPGKGKYHLTAEEFSNIWTNILLLVEKRDDFTTENDAPSYIHIFVDVFKKNYIHLIIITLFSILINGVGILGALFFKYLTDHIIPSNLISNLHLFGFAILSIYILNTIIMYIRYQFVLKLSLQIDINLMKDYFYHVLHLPTNFFDTRKSGEILQRFMDISKIREVLSSSTVTLLVDTLMIIVGAFLLYMQSPLLLLVTVIFIPLFIAGAYVFKKPFEKYNQKASENEAELSSYLIESFEGNATIKSYQSEEDTYQKGVSKFNQFIENLLKLGRFSNIQLTYNNFLKLIISIVILWLGGYLVIQNYMSLGSLLAFNVLMVYYLDPIERLINIQPSLQSSFVAARRIAEITDLDTENNLSNQSLPFTFENHITMKNVTFQYGFRNVSLKNIDLKIPKGQKIAIVGESGSGKSTLGKLLARYYDASDGEILIDQQNIGDIQLSEMRRSIGYVSQDTFLFADTITNNLKNGINQSRTEEELIHACKQAECFDFIQRLPNQFQTMLEKEAANLSGGQAQRLSIARTFLKDPTFFIFDEATSALDSITETKIMKNIDALIHDEGKTAIIISHKLSTIKNADMIYVLKDGEIVEQGSHESLINNQHEYYQLWHLQKL
ncbi:peptidase domain-containing ABC transporter [Staphylococcus rostri]|uniref:Peptide cleavage/export ABC transporter n=1 Tax=Staphylococcus rostri TaxID=522262 RepID=A0A2K3YLX7_9STAP|nr:peptidase domain-containing ABC transporter [Staphylococcus rostri]PNZ26258.1 peptide cleavage/export ABC transporter [Staphylococcus rostri]